jgi:uncharacterized protein (DUF433 family)
MEMIAMDYSKNITIDPGTRSGKACIHGTRIAVDDVLGYLSAGVTHKQILDDFPDLNESDIEACLKFAANTQRD